MKEKSGSEAVKKGETSVNQIENKGEGITLLGLYNSPSMTNSILIFVVKCATKRHFGILMKITT